MTDFIPIQMSKSDIPGYFTMQNAGGILRDRREMLGYSSGSINVLKQMKEDFPVQA